MLRRVAIYARLSVTSEESVSIERQFEACRKAAERWGAVVVGEYKDEGVSATVNKPEDREGWKALLGSSEQYDAVVVWKVDRLARRVLDFLHANETLQARSAAIVAAEDPIDMTTPQGRAFATMLSVFAEMEAAATSARIRGARTHLIRSGRVVGGTVPYGWRSIPNPSGSGLVLAQDEERIRWVRGMAERALRGDSIYSIKQWLDAEGAPLPSASQKRRKREGWNYFTVERILRSPVLAGMKPYQPGRARHDPIDPTAVLRDDQGMPVVDKRVAILTTDERRRLLHVLETRDSPQARPRASKGVTSPLLSGLAACGHCERTMHRGTTQGRPSLSCPGCHQTVSRSQLDDHIGSRLLAARGHVNLWEYIETSADNSAQLGDIEAAIRDTTASMADDDADMTALGARLDGLKEMRAKARASNPTTRTWRITGKTVREAWEAEQNDDSRRQVLTSQIQRLVIVRGRVGRYLDPNRVHIEWVPVPDGLPLPDGTTIQRRLDAVPDGKGMVGGVMLNAPDGERLYAASDLQGSGEIEEPRAPI